MTHGACPPCLVTLRESLRLELGPVREVVDPDVSEG